MTRLPLRYAPYVYGILQSAITTAVATGVATAQLVGLGMPFLVSWPVAWLFAWLAMLPIVMLIAPHIQRAVLRLICEDTSGPRPQ